MKNDILEIIESDQSNLLILGKAGVGKSTLIQTLKSKLGQKCIIVCPTGIAAQNVSGQTIHSFFKIPSRLELKFPEITSCGQDLGNLLTSELKELNTIILDEISMVNQYVLESVSQILMVAKKNPSPFGGMRLILIGDLFQLPPVDKDKLIGNKIFFWNSISFQRANFKCFELTKVFRQEQTIENQKFIEILGRIRLYEATQEDLDFLNIRVSEVVDFSNKTILCSKNDTAVSYNSRGLQKLSTEEFTFHAQVNGTWSKNDYPKEPLITLKVGAPVLFMRNDPNGKYKNGTRGTITEIFFDQQKVKVSLANDEVLDIAYVTWGHPKFNKPFEGERTEIIEQFKHFPIILGYAITIHRCQGMTLDSIHLDLGTGAFAPGQLYVALSRLRNFDGLSLASPIKRKDILTSNEILLFYQSFKPQPVEFNISLNQKLNTSDLSGKNLTPRHLHTDSLIWSYTSTEMRQLTTLTRELAEKIADDNAIKTFNLNKFVYDLHEQILQDSHDSQFALIAALNVPRALSLILYSLTDLRSKLRSMGLSASIQENLEDRFKDSLDEVEKFIAENKPQFGPSANWAILYQKANQDFSRHLFKCGYGIEQIIEKREEFGFKKLYGEAIIGHILNTCDHFTEEELIRITPETYLVEISGFYFTIPLEEFEKNIIIDLRGVKITPETTLNEIANYLIYEFLSKSLLVLIAKRNNIFLGKYSVEKKLGVEENELFFTQTAELINSNDLEF